MIVTTLCFAVLFSSGLLVHADDGDLQAGIEKMEQVIKEMKRVHTENADYQARMERMEDYVEKIEEYSRALSAGELIYSTG